MNTKTKSKISRRSFLALAAGTGAALAFTPHDKYLLKLIPYVNAPKFPKPGQWAFYATACRECPAGCGLMMWHRDGRVTKAEGNPLHPVNGGKLCIRGQSSVLGEYDPNRLKQVAFKEESGNFTGTSWKEAFKTIKSEMTNAGSVRLISNLQTGSLDAAMKQFTQAHSQSPLYYEAFNYEAMRLANKEMYGQAVIPKYDLSNSDLIISFGADFLETWLSPVEYARDFSDFHSPKNKGIGKFIYLGPVQTMTAVNSDEYIIIQPDSEAELIITLIRKLQQKGIIETAINLPSTSKSIPETLNKHLDKLAKEISRAGSPMILAGRPNDSSIQAKQSIMAANLLNDLLGNRNRINFSKPHALSNTALRDDVNDFFNSITKDTILVIHNTNPVYSEPGIEKHLKKAKKIVYIGYQQNETSALADWVLPSHYPLEEWGDYEAWKGTVSLMQPTLRPLYDTKSAGDIFLKLTGSLHSYQNTVKNNWRSWMVESPLKPIKTGDSLSKSATNNSFKNLARKGFLERPVNNLSINQAATISTITATKIEEGSFHLRINPSLLFYDGSLSNRGLLQEIPHPVSNIVWQNWIDMNRDKAEELEIEEGDMLKVSSSAGSLKIPVRLSEEIHSHTLAIDTGQGHHHMGKTADGIGHNAFTLSSLHHNGTLEVSIEKTGENESLLYLNATKNQHHRELLQHVELEKLQQGNFKEEKVNWPLPRGYTKNHDLYDGHKHKDHRWGMVIDLQKCIGCKACEAACYAENNIPVVGKQHAAEGREMSWLKVVPYKMGDHKTAYLPLPCQHCDSAPCEPVCPVYASVHTEEGLNAQVYNRCIGTRYCSNNCPYKVRRFNWSNIDHPYPGNLQLNPEVTVRDRGVMEKCTFCVQRIRNKQYQAKIEKRALSDGEIVPACAQTCPTGAITFGDLMDENAQVSKLIRDKRRYQLLNELNTKTAVIYLKKINLKNS